MIEDEVFFEYFDKDLFNIESPHYCAARTLAEYFIYGINTSKNASVFWEKFNYEMSFLFSLRSPGFGLHEVGVTGFFDDEWMHEHNIPFFEEGETFVFEIEDNGLTYSLVQYSREEMKGWVATALRNSMGNEVVDKSLSLINEGLGDKSLVENLKDKCAGRTPWDYGPYDNTKEEVERWHSTRCNPVIERDS